MPITLESRAAAGALGGQSKSERKRAASKRNLAAARLAQARKLLAQEPVVFQCSENQSQELMPATIATKNGKLFIPVQTKVQN